MISDHDKLYAKYSHISEILGVLLNVIDASLITLNDDDLAPNKKLDINEDNSTELKTAAVNVSRIAREKLKNSEDLQFNIISNCARLYVISDMVLARRNCDATIKILGDIRDSISANYESVLYGAANFSPILSLKG